MYRNRRRDMGKRGRKPKTATVCAGAPAAKRPRRGGAEEAAVTQPGTSPATASAPPATATGGTPATQPAQAHPMETTAGPGEPSNVSTVCSNSSTTTSIDPGTGSSNVLSYVMGNIQSGANTNPSFPSVIPSAANMMAAGFTAPIQIGQNSNPMPTPPILQVSGGNPLSPQGEYLGASVPQNIKERIWKGEYVEFSLLIPNRSSTARAKIFAESGIEQMGSELTVFQKGQQIVFRPTGPKRQIWSIEKWTDAFLVFSSIYLQKKPQYAQELMKYGSIIRSAARNYAGLGWREYDIEFRERMQVNQNKAWGGH